MVRLDAAGRDESVTLPSQRFSDQEFELAELVASAADSREIIALHEQTNAGGCVPERLLEAVEPLDRGDAVEQGDPVVPSKRR
jgi:hypothetical protein